MHVRHTDAKKSFANIFRIRCTRPLTSLNPSRSTLFIADFQPPDSCDQRWTWDRVPSCNGPGSERQDPAAAEQAREPI